MNKPIVSSIDYPTEFFNTICLEAVISLAGGAKCGFRPITAIDR